MRKRKILVSLTAIAILAIFLIINFMRKNYVVPIIMYHQVFPNSDPEYRLAVSLETFERQMRFLKTSHYNVIGLEDLANLIRDKKKIPPRTIAITLDDGYLNSYTYAFPILKKYNLPATVFIIAGEVGRRDKSGLRDRLSWEEIKEMQESGIISVGSHCLGPEPLTNIKNDEDLRKEIFDSKKILEEKLGKTVNAFSYPEGKFNDSIKQLVINAGYKLAVATNPGKKFPPDDLFTLKRLRISENSANLFIFWVEASGYYNIIRENRHKKWHKPIKEY